MAPTLRLIAGDKRNPYRSVAIAHSSGSADVNLRNRGFSPGPGKKTVQWSGESSRFDGEQRVSSNRGNRKLAITYDLTGGSAAELLFIQSQINRFFEDIRFYEEEKGSVPCWLEYRQQEGLDDFPAPAFGQLSQYIRVLDGEVPEWPQSLHSGALLSHQIEMILMNLICGPFWEGLNQEVLKVNGHFEVNNHGLFLPSSNQNIIPNPSFGHSTWNTSWSVSDATLKATQSTQSNYYWSMRSAARLVNTHASTARQFTITATLTAVTYWMSCKVRKPDGSAVTSSDITMWGQGASRTTTFVQIDGGPWYFAYASFTGVAVSSTHGVQVPAGKTVYIDDAQLDLQSAALLFPRPFISGHLPGCTWAGTAHSSVSSQVGSFNQNYASVTLTDELTGEFTISGWFVPHWKSATGGTDVWMFEYGVDGANFLRLIFNLNTNVYTLNKSATTDTSAAQTIAFMDKVHFTIVQNATNLTLYINGVATTADITTTPSLPASGTFRIGGRVTGGPNETIFATVDGWRIWKSALSAAQISSLYSAESAVKNRTGGGVLGMPPVWWNKDADGILDAVDDTNRDNWSIIAGVPGDVEALTEWRIQGPTSTPPRGYWIGRKAVDEPFDAALLFVEFQGTVDANSSGGEYQATTSAGEMTPFEAMTTDLSVFRGRYEYLGRILVGTNSVTIKPAYHLGTAALGNNAVRGDPKTWPVGGFYLADFGELEVGYDDLRLEPSQVYVFLSVTPTTGSSTIWVDFVQLLPYPCCYVQAIDASITINAGDVIIINGTEAYVRVASTGLHAYTFEHRGDAVDVKPNKYNYIWFLPGESGAAYDITDTGAFQVFITPRWLLPGGLVA